MKVTLVNLNLIRVPAIAPYAIDVLGSALEHSGHAVQVLDLCRADDPVEAIHQYFSAHQADLVGVSMRNAHDGYLPSIFDLKERGSFLPSHRRLLEAMMRHVAVDRIVVGGIGFSLNPHAFLARVGLRYGVRGPGEGVLTQLADGLARGSTLQELAGGSPTHVFDGRTTGSRGPVARRYVDHRWYYEYGGQAALRSTSGCAMRCAYCAEPVGAGGSYRKSAIEHAIGEIDQLFELGVRDIQTADSEFNLPLGHSKELLRAIARRGYGKDLRIWAYCQPRPFDEEYARLLAAAGVAGIDFGTDHLDPEMLVALHKWYTKEDVIRATKLCQDHGIAVMHELLFGMPGDSPDRMYRAIDELRRLDPWVIGVSIGLALFPDTPLGVALGPRAREGEPGFYCAGEPMVDPTFFVDPSFELPAIFDRLTAAVGPDSGNIMLPASSSTASVNNQLVNSDRVRHQLLVEKRKGPSWYHYPSGGA